jgi:predicted RNA-binding protein (virulence factor B family)
VLQIGKFNKLEVLHTVDFGLYLDGDDCGEILLPTRYVPRDFEIGGLLDVFICFDSDDRLIATTEIPFAQVGEFALLKVISVNNIGAFLNWGLPKDLFLPFAEQTQSVRVGEAVFVSVYLDNSERIAASMRIERFLQRGFGDLQDGQRVELIVAKKSDLGLKAIINNTYIGMLYEDEIFKPLRSGQKIAGYIKKLRDDGKIDLSLQQTGHKAATGIAPRILELLQKNGGRYAINDKTSAEKIHDLFGVSKKQYKIALGGLYKQRQVLVTEAGIELVPQVERTFTRPTVRP